MIITSGDWHGEFNTVIREIKRLDLQDCTIFQVGDFGMGFAKLKKDLRQLDRFNLTLRVRNIYLYAIRGNHDNPKYFDGSISTSNIKLLPDYSVVQVDDQNILCIGGAISIDRKPNAKQVGFDGKPWKGRKEGVNYWADEALVFKPELVKDLNNIDIVITHSAPDFCQPRIKNGLSTWATEDLGLIEECAVERNNLSKIYDILKANNCPLKSWFYGHFHFHETERFENTDFTVLDINEFWEVRI